MVLAVWPGLLAACGGDVDAGGDASVLDAPAIDAPTIDAPTNDAATDAPPDAGPDAALDAAVGGGAVSVTVYDRRNATGPVAGAHVLFMTGGGTLESRTTTDPAGRASGVVPPGGSLVVVDGALLTSFLAVGDGDELVVAGTAEPGAGPMNATVVVPAGPAGTTNYRIYGTCINGASLTTTIQVTLEGVCPAGPRDVVVTALANGVHRGYVLAPAASLPPGTTLTLPGPWQAPTSFSASIGGVPPMSAVAVAHWPTAATAELSLGIHSMPDPVGGATAGTLPHPPPIGDGTLVAAFAFGGNGLAHTLSTHHAGRVTTLAIPDLGAELLPVASNVTANQTSASWALGTGRPYDGVVLWLDAYLKGWKTGTWRVVAPPGTAAVALPALPGDLAGRWWPDTWVDVNLLLIDSHVAPGREFREQVFTGAMSLTGGPPPNTVRLMQVTRQVIF